jgi:WS/DGAT C-terminal domain
VFVACCAGAVRRFLAERSYDPDRGPLVASIPLSRRGPENMDGIGNFTAVDYMWLGSDVADPVERLRKCHEAARAMKEHFVASEGGDIASILGVLPPPGARLLNRIIGSKQGRTGLMGNLVLSNVPGPPESLYFGSTRVENWFSMGQLFDGRTLNMTVWSYAGNMQSERPRRSQGDSRRLGARRPLSGMPRRASRQGRTRAANGKRVSRPRVARFVAGRSVGQRRAEGKQPRALQSHEVVKQVQASADADREPRRDPPRRGRILRPRLR